MIIRINEFDPANADAYSGWEFEPYRGPIEYDWPADSHAFEILVLETDERHQVIAEDFRKQQLRRILPRVVEVLSERGEELVARFDGPMSPSGLVPVLKHCTDSLGRGRFAISPVVQLDSVAPAPVSSVRVHLPAGRFREMIEDSDIALDGDVRMRLLSVQPSLVNPLIDIDDLGDIRWSQVLASSAFMLSTNWQMTGVQLLTRQLDAAQAQQRLAKLETA